MKLTTHYGYGFFPGGDPRKFIPDGACCNPKEITAWKEVCAEWDKGNEIECVGSHRWITDENGKVIGTATVSSFGLGQYEYEYEEECEE